MDELSQEVLVQKGKLIIFPKSKSTFVYFNWIESNVKKYWIDLITYKFDI